MTCIVLQYNIGLKDQPERENVAFPDRTAEQNVLLQSKALCSREDKRDYGGLERAGLGPLRRLTSVIQIPTRLRISGPWGDVVEKKCQLLRSPY